MLVVLAAGLEVSECAQGRVKVMKQKRKLSTLEHVAECNIVYFVRLEGSFHVDQLRSALSRGYQCARAEQISLEEPDQ